MTDEERAEKLQTFTERTLGIAEELELNPAEACSGLVILVGVIIFTQGKDTVTRFRALQELGHLLIHIGMHGPEGKSVPRSGEQEDN